MARNVESPRQKPRKRRAKAEPGATALKTSNKRRASAAVGGARTTAAAAAAQTPRQRAQKGLADAAEKAGQGFDDLVGLSRAANAFTAQRLDATNNSVDRLAADVVALSINAFAPLLRCFAARGTGKAPGEEPDVRPVAAATLVFDIRSEAAGPITLEFTEPISRVASKRPLVGQGRSITADKIIVRQPQPRQLLLSLSDLRGLNPGSYRGSLQIETQAGALFDIDVAAECRAGLWWRSFAGPI